MEYFNHFNLFNCFKLKVTAMKTKLLISFLFFVFCIGTAQVPQGFNYQAIAKDGSMPITTTIQVMITITDSAGVNTFWKELHSSVTPNSSGLFSLVVGMGTRQTGSSVSKFSDIDWVVSPKFIRTEINYGGWKTMGSSKLWAVPYATVANDLGSTLKQLKVKGNNTSLDSALFEVKNNNGQTVFAVYNEGVRVYVDDGLPKGTKGGFAIGGFGTGKSPSQNLFLVKSDTIRMYIDDRPGKGTKGGFAIGGFSTGKGNTNFFNVATDAAGVINPAQNRILWYPLKNAFLTGNVIIEHPDSVGINSFSTGYQSRAKGLYSQAMGYSAIARGSYSTSIGRNSLSKGANSFAFGNQSSALANDSYAFGTGAEASGGLSFALGSVGVDSTGKPTGKTKASGYGAFAIGFGSVSSGQGAFSIGVSDTASGPFSTAMGYQTSAKGWFATSMGAGTKAKAPFSTSLGWGPLIEDAGWCAIAGGASTKAGNWAAVALGDRTYASGHTSLATGYSTTASGHLSATFGEFTTASGDGSTAMGHNTTAQAYGSLVVGRYNTLGGNSTAWNFWDPVLVVGNGNSATDRSNAMTVYNSGIADFGSFINLSTKSTYNEAIMVNNSQALWYDGTYYSWGYGGTYNVFARKVSVGTTANPGSYTLYVNGNSYINGYAYCTLGAWSGSDVRWKKNLRPIENIANDVFKLQGYKYSWRADEFPDMKFDEDIQIGLVAQEVEKIFPELVKTDNNGFKAVAYDKLSVLLLEGMKEQQKQIESQNSKIEKLQKIVDQLIVEKGVK
jgi:hypothetical protein